MAAVDGRADAVPLEGAGLAVVAGEDHGAVREVGHDRPHLLGVLGPADRLGLVVVELAVERVGVRRRRQHRDQRGPGDGGRQREHGADRDQAAGAAAAGHPGAAGRDQRDDRAGQVVALAAGDEEDQQSRPRRPGRAAGPGATRGRCSSLTSPATQTTKTSGLNMIAAWPTSSIRPPRPPYSSAMSADRSKTGQPWSACQSRLGTHISAAIRPASHGQRVRSSGRSSRSSSAARPGWPEQEHDRVLVVEADPGDHAGQPATAAGAGRAPPGSTSTSTAVQARVSKVAVDSRWPSAMTTAEAATTAAVSTWPPRAAPSSRANCTASSTMPTTASTRRQPQHHEVVRRDLGGQPREQRRERRLVGVAPRQPLTGRDEVELVAVRPVERRHRQQYGGLHGHHRADLAPRERRALLGHARILSRSRASTRSSRPSPSRR